MASPNTLMILMMMLSRGGGNDLLDFVQARAYWELKGVKMTPAAMVAELAPPKADAVAKLVEQAGEGDAKAAEKILALGPAALPTLQKAAKAAEGQADKAGKIQTLITQVYRRPKAGAVRRLMAIRALGELKSPRGAAALKALADSKALFEADYARGALAAIAGKAQARPGPDAAARAKDMALLPADCGIVGQITVPGGGKPVDFAAAMKDAAPMFGGQDPKTVMQNVVRMLLEAVERVGNVRIHSVTLGVSAKIGHDDGFVVFVGRGLYDHKAVAQLLADQKRTETETIGGVEVIRPEDSMALILPSDREIVMLGGPKKEALPVAAVAAAVKAGKGGFDPAGPLGKLMKTIDTTAPLWAAALIGDSYREGGPIIAAFDSATLVGQATKTGQNLTLTGKGADATKVGEAVKQIEEGLTKAREELGREVERMPMLKSVTGILASIKVKQAGATMTITGEVQGDSSMSMLPMMLFGRAGGGPPPQRREPARPVPPGNDF